MSIKLKLLFALFLFCANQNLTFGQDVTYDQLLDALRGASREDRALALQELAKESITIVQNKDIKGDPIRSDSALVFINYYIRYNEILGKNPEELEKSVFFRREEVQRLLNLPYSNGIRVYFGKYPYNFKITPGSGHHEFVNKNTVILRATYGTDDYPYSESAITYPAVDYGDICPPNCSPTPVEHRSSEERRQGASNVKHVKGGNFTRSGVIPRTEPIQQN